MVSNHEILMVDSGEHSLRALASQARGLEYRVVTVKTPEGAHAVLVDPRHDIGAAVITPDMPASSLAGAVDALRDLASHRRLPVLAVGQRGDASVSRKALRDAGVDLALADPMDEHTLRFQLNRALAENYGTEKERRYLRVPADWPVRMRVGSREKEARVYSVSAAGAYLATDRPVVRNAIVYLTLPLPGGSVTTTARVVMTNVPGNLKRTNLPLGMGVRFTGTPEETSRAIEAFARARHQHLVI